MAFFSFLDQKKKKDALRELAKERKRGIPAERLNKANEEILSGSGKDILLCEYGRGGGHQNYFGNGFTDGEKSVRSPMYSGKRASDGGCRDS